MKHTSKIEKQNKFKFVNPIQKELEYFIVCAESGSILRAAEQLDIQQAGLSKMMQKLEFEIGQKIFYRKSRGIELTEFGQNLYAVLLKTKSYWNESFSTALKESMGVSGVLKIGCHSSVASNTLPLFFSSLISKFPHLKIEVDLDTSLEITRKVAQLQIDLGLVINPVKNQELIAKPIHMEHVAVWRAQKTHDPILVHNPDMYMAPKFLKKFPDHKLIAIKDYEVIANMVRNTHFLGVLPSPVAERYGFEQVGEKIISVQLAMIWHKDKFADKARYQIIEEIMRHL